ncbi:MAG: NAD-dependent epimerase/dehydratase family protein [Candidatus Curtissbacteria bacterium]|nr:NAD-dependent epimerase/dehydratase family protein [Candidatus Curtissbacteria bacterium]
MKYLVTGGAGFIGSHLVDRLLKEDSEVAVIDGHGTEITIVDDFSHGKYANLPDDPRLTVYDTDILGDVGRLFKGVDVVFHLAALTRPQWSIEHASETDQVNVNGTVKVLEHCRDNKVKRVVFMSSSNLYGEQELYPTPEDVKPNPMNAYALSKLIGEQYCQLFEKLYGLEFNAIRPFNAYGTRMPVEGIYTSAVATYINALKKDIPFVKFGDGEQRRDFIYIDDIVELLMLMAQSDVHGEIFNCGSGTNNSINELLATIRKLMGKEIEPTPNPAQYEPSQTLADIRKARIVLGWEPKVSLEEGLRRTILNDK